MLQILADAERTSALPKNQRTRHPGAPSQAEVAEWMRFFGLEAPDDDPDQTTDPDEGEDFASADVERLLAGFDPKDLDMARWLDDDGQARSSPHHPHPPTGGDTLTNDDTQGTHD
jgi:hypothetical protein